MLCVPGKELWLLVHTPQEQWVGFRGRQEPNPVPLFFRFQPRTSQVLPTFRPREADVQAAYHQTQSEGTSSPSAAHRTGL